MGEEREVVGEVEQRNGFDLAPIGVDHVAQRLEREERDADRQDDLEQRRRHLDAEVARTLFTTEVGEEAVVLEVRRATPRLTATAAIRHHPAQWLARGRDQLMRTKIWFAIVDAAQQEDVVPVPPAVEDVAGDHHEHLPPASGRAAAASEDEHDREEDRELDGGEEHRGAEPRGPPCVPTGTSGETAERCHFGRCEDVTARTRQSLERSIRVDT